MLTLTSILTPNPPDLSIWPHVSVYKVIPTEILFPLEVWNFDTYLWKVYFSYAAFSLFKFHWFALCDVFWWNDTKIPDFFYYNYVLAKNMLIGIN